MPKTVLVVDQDTVQLTKVVRFWADAPWRTITATSIQEAIDILEDENIQMLITTELHDWLDGREFLRLTHHRYPQMLRILVPEDVSKQVFKNVSDEPVEFRVHDNIHYIAPYSCNTEYMTHVVSSLLGITIPIKETVIS